jgi:hypothetical protein
LFESPVIINKFVEPRNKIKSNRMSEQVPLVNQEKEEAHPCPAGSTAVGMGKSEHRVDHGRRPRCQNNEFNNNKNNIGNAWGDESG